MPPRIVLDLLCARSVAGLRVPCTSSLVWMAFSPVYTDCAVHTYGFPQLLPLCAQLSEHKSALGYVVCDVSSLRPQYSYQLKELLALASSCLLACTLQGAGGWTRLSRAADVGVDCSASPPKHFKGTRLLCSNSPFLLP